MRRIKTPSPAMVVAMVALFIALGGAGYAAVSIPRNSVGTNQLKNFAVTPLKVAPGAIKTKKLRDNAVTTPKIADAAVTTPKIADGAVNSAKVLDGSLLPADVVSGFQIPGMITAHARIQADGTLEPNQFRNIVQANIEHVVGTGVYCFGGLTSVPTSAMVSLDNAQIALADLDRVLSVAVFRGNVLADCGAGFQQARVRITDTATPTPAVQDARFYIWFM
jgi:hypothetical protein